MSRKHRKASAKRIQKLTREGLVELNRVTGEERRVTQEDADYSFVPQRQSPQAPAVPQSGHRKQQRYMREQAEIAVPTIDQTVSETPPGPANDAIFEEDTTVFAQAEYVVPEGLPQMRAASDKPLLATVSLPEQIYPRSRRQRRAKREKHKKKLHKEHNGENLHFEPEPETIPADSRDGFSEIDTQDTSSEAELPAQNRPPGKSEEMGKPPQKLHFDAQYQKKTAENRTPSSERERPKRVLASERERAEQKASERSAEPAQVIRKQKPAPYFAGHIAEVPQRKSISAVPSESSATHAGSEEQPIPLTSEEAPRRQREESPTRREYKHRQENAALPTGEKAGIIERESRLYSEKRHMPFHAEGSADTELPKQERLYREKQTVTAKRKPDAAHRSSHVTVSRQQYVPPDSSDTQIQVPPPERNAPRRNRTWTDVTETQFPAGPAVPRRKIPQTRDKVQTIPEAEGANDESVIRQAPVEVHSPHLPPEEAPHTIVENTAAHMTKLNTESHPILSPSVRRLEQAENAPVGENAPVRKDEITHSEPPPIVIKKSATLAFPIPAVRENRMSRPEPHSKLEQDRPSKLRGTNLMPDISDQPVIHGETQYRLSFRNVERIAEATVKNDASVEPNPANPAANAEEYPASGEPYQAVASAEWDSAHVPDRAKEEAEPPRPTLSEEKEVFAPAPKRRAPEALPHNPTKSSSAVKRTPGVSPNTGTVQTPDREKTPQNGKDEAALDETGRIPAKRRLRFDDATESRSQTGANSKSKDKTAPVPADKLVGRAQSEFQQEPELTPAPRRRLRFEDEDTLPSRLPAAIDIGAGVLIKTAKYAAAQKTEPDKEQNNAAVDAAERGAGTAKYLARKQRRGRRIRNASSRSKRFKQEKAAVERESAILRDAVRQFPKLEPRLALRKWLQRKQTRKKSVLAAREAKQAGQIALNSFVRAGKVIRATLRKAAAAKYALGVIAALVLVIVLFSVGLTSCTAIMSGFQSSYISASYLANESDLCKSDLRYTELETDLQLDISATETQYPGYDEYRYHIGEISHDPYELLAYLSVRYNAFTYESVKTEIERIFRLQYTLTRTPVTETKYDASGNPYDWHVLQTTLTVQPLYNIIAANLLPGEEWERYAIYMQTYGNRQAFGNPFDISWLPYVSDGYGYRIHPTTGEKNLHCGIDLALPQGTPVKAVQDGRVLQAGSAGTYGNCIVIEGEKGYQSRYAHLATLSVSAGQTVKRGDTIGTVGSTGRSTGPHLHLEVILNGEYLNPFFFVDNGSSGGAIPGTPGGIVIPEYPGEPPTDETYAAMLAEAEKYLGYPYVWGGSSPSTSFDCSGYVSWVVNHSGWNVGRLGAYALFNLCTPVSPADAKPGDLIFFTRTYSAPNPVSHVGIYVGNGQMLHCGDPIQYANINSRYWQEHFYAFGRMPSPS